MMEKASIEEQRIRNEENDKDEKFTGNFMHADFHVMLYVPVVTL